MKELPKTVKIGGIVFEVLEKESFMSSDLIKLNGQTNLLDCTITIDKDLSIQKKSIVLWNEIVHVFLEQSGIEDDEKLAGVLGYAICGFIQDNPEVING
jgi:hypothetical protein